MWQPPFYNVSGEKSGIGRKSLLGRRSHPTGCGDGGGKEREKEGKGGCKYEHSQAPPAERGGRRRLSDPRRGRLSDVTDEVSRR